MKMSVAKNFAMHWIEPREKYPHRLPLPWDRRADGPARSSSQFSAAGWRSVTLGSTILRAETAAIAALAAVAALLD